MKGGLPLSRWMQLGLLGVLFYELTQGAQFPSLAYLPAATVSLPLNLSPVAVLLPGSVGVAAAILLAVGITVQGSGRLRVLDWAIIGWLAVARQAEDSVSSTWRRLAGRFVDDSDFVLRQIIQFIHDRVNVAVCGVEDMLCTSRRRCDRVDWLNTEATSP